MGLWASTPVLTAWIGWTGGGEGRDGEGRGQGPSLDENSLSTSSARASQRDDEGDGCLATEGAARTVQQGSIVDMLCMVLFTECRLFFSWGVAWGMDWGRHQGAYGSWAESQGQRVTAAASSKSPKNQLQQKVNRRKSAPGLTNTETADVCQGTSKAALLNWNHPYKQEILSTILSVNCAGSILKNVSKQYVEKNE